MTDSKFESQIMNRIVQGQSKLCNFQKHAITGISQRKPLMQNKEKHLNWRRKRSPSPRQISRKLNFHNPDNECGMDHTVWTRTSTIKFVSMGRLSVLINSTPAVVGENKFWKNQKQILRWLLRWQTTNHRFIQFQKKSLLKIVLRQDPSTFSSRSATVRQYFNWSFTSVSSVVYFFEICTIRSRDPWNEMGPKSSLDQMLIPSFIVSKAFSRSSLNFFSIFDL